MENFSSYFNECGGRRVYLPCILAAALASCVIPATHAQVVVVPNALATEDGDSKGTSTGTLAVRVMTIVDAAQFSALAGPSFLTQLSRRPDAGSAAATGTRTVVVRIYASTTKRSVDEMSTTFSENTGTNRTLVLDGKVTLSSQNQQGPGNTRQFDIVFPFTKPFFYDPAEGNLLLELQSTGVAGLLEWDEVSFDPAIQTLLAPGSTSAATGNFRGSGVYQYTFAAPASATVRASQVEVGWNSQPNVSYQVQYRSELTTNLWTSLLDCIRSTNSTTSIFDTIAPGAPKRFYRVIPANCPP